MKVESCLGDGYKGMKKEGPRTHKPSVTYLTQEGFFWVFFGMRFIGRPDVDYDFSSSLTSAYSQWSE